MKPESLCLVILLVFAQTCEAQSVTLTAQVEQTDEELEQQLVLRALDRGPVFTLLGDIKPMSSDIWQVKLDSPDLDLEKVDRVRRLMAVFNDDRTYGDVITITHTVRSIETPSLEAVVFDRVALARTLKRQSEFFGKYGITESSHPLHVAVTVGHMPSLDRERGYGYLFGYPDHAVDFFVAAQKAWVETGEFVKRDFVRIETYSGNGTVWAVPKGETSHVENLEFVRNADKINMVYREMRKQNGDDHTKLLAQIRQWKGSNLGQTKKQGVTAE